MGLVDGFKQISLEKFKAAAREYTGYLGTFDKAADMLVAAHNNGENIFINFNGTKLYSVETANVDDAYMQYMGTTKAEHEAQMEAQRQKWAEERERAEAAAKEKIPDWIERGNKVIMPGMEDSWKECVAIRAGDLYNGAELENALQIMEKLANGGTIEEAMEIFDDAGHSGMSASMTKAILLSFCEQGVDFYRRETERYTAIDSKLEARLQQQQEENDIRFGRYNEQDAKTDLLQSLKATQSWIKADALMELLPPEQQEALKEAVEKDKDIMFTVRPAKDGGFEFREFFAFGEPVTFPIDPAKINLEKLAQVTEAAMIPHLQYGRWHGTSTLATPEMVEAKLESTIEKAHQIARIENEKSIENSVGNDVLTNDNYNNDDRTPQDNNEKPNRDENNLEDPDDR